jgi:hypothetical protein
VSSLAATLDTLIGAAPPVPPSGAFAATALNGLPLDPVKSGSQQALPDPARSGWRSRHHPRRSEKARRLVLALGLVLAFTAVSYAVWGRSPHHRGSGEVAVTMRGDEGQPVGQAVLSNQVPASIAVDFDVQTGARSSPNGRYRVIALQRDRHPLLLGVVTVSAGHGGLHAQTNVPTHDIVAVEVLRSDGTGLCSGTLPPPPNGARPPSPPNGAKVPPPSRGGQSRAFS